MSFSKAQKQEKMIIQFKLNRQQNKSLTYLYHINDKLNQDCNEVGLCIPCFWPINANQSKPTWAIQSLMSNITAAQPLSQVTLSISSAWYVSTRAGPIWDTYLMIQNLSSNQQKQIITFACTPFKTLITLTYSCRVITNSLIGTFPIFRAIKFCLEFKNDYYLFSKNVSLVHTWTV